MRNAGWALSFGMLMGCAQGLCQTAAPVSGPRRAATGSNAAATAPADAVQEFEVATVKPSDPKNCCGKTWNVNGRQFLTYNTSLKWLIKFAYGLHDKQIAGGPAWLDVDPYNVTGEGTRPLNISGCRAGLQKLLADRFQLKFHYESREIPAYVVTLAHGGAKLTRSDPEKDKEKQLSFSGAVGQTMHGFARDATLDDFLAELQRLALDRPVVNRTGITGTYNIEFAFTREDPEALGMAELPDDAPPNLLTAMNQQLGLKLQGVKAPVQVLVIDGAERPSQN